MYKRQVGGRGVGQRHEHVVGAVAYGDLPGMAADGTHQPGEVVGQRAGRGAEYGVGAGGPSSGVHQAAHQGEAVLERGVAVGVRYAAGRAVGAPPGQLRAEDVRVERPVVAAVEVHRGGGRDGPLGAAVGVQQIGAQCAGGQHPLVRMAGGDDPQVLVIALHGAAVRQLQPPHVPFALGEDAVDEGALAAGDHHLGADGHLPHRPEALRRQHQGVQRLGLAGAHFALEEAVHGVAGGQVVEDLAADALLAVGEGERQFGVEGVEQSVGLQRPRDGGELGFGQAPAGQRDLEDECLVPLEAGAGVGDIGLGARPVDRVQRIGEREQIAAFAQRVGQRVDGVLGAGQYRVHGLGDLPGGHLLTGRVDRHELVGEGADRVGPGVVAVLVQELVFRMGKLESAVEDGDLAGEHRAAAGQQFLVGFVDALAEEHQPQPAAAVGEGDLQAFAAAAVEGVDAGVGDLGDDGDVFVHRQLGEAGELAALGVAPGVVVQQIADRFQAEVLGQHFRGAAAEDLLQGFVERCHTLIAHHGSDIRGVPTLSPVVCPRLAVLLDADEQRRRMLAAFVDDGVDGEIALADVLFQPFGQGCGNAVAQDEGDHFAARGEHPVEHRHGGGGQLGADHRDIAVDQAEDVAGLADAGHRPRLAFGDGQLGVAGGAGGRGHGDDVLVEAAVGFVDGEGGDALDRGAGGDQGDADAFGAGLFGGGRGGVPQVGVVGQQHHLAGVCLADGLDQFAAGGRFAGAYGDGGGARLGAQSGEPGTGDDGDDGPGGQLGFPGAGGAAEVGDGDAVGAAGLDAGLDGGARVVGVDVDVPQAVAADDDQGVAQGVEAGAQPGHGGVVGLQEVDHLEGGAVLVGVRAAVHLVPGRLAAAGLRERGVGPQGDGCRRRLAGQGVGEGAEQGDQAAAAGVHDAGPAEDRELGGGGLQGGAGAVVGGPCDGGGVPGGGFGGGGGGGGDGQDGALHGVGDGLVGGGGGPAQGAAQRLGPAVGPAARRQDLGHPAQQLGDDGAGVAAGADEGAVGHGADGVGQAGCGSGGGVAVEGGLDGAGGGFEGQVEVGAGVAVGHRVDVDRVDPLALPAERFQGQPAPGAYRGGVERVGHIVLLDRGMHRTVAALHNRGRGGCRGLRDSFVLRERPLYAAPVAR